jgi:hypothetical protein
MLHRAIGWRPCDQVMSERPLVRLTPELSAPMPLWGDGDSSTCQSCCCAGWLRGSRISMPISSGSTGGNRVQPATPGRLRRRRWRHCFGRPWVIAPASASIYGRWRPSLAVSRIGSRQVGSLWAHHHGPKPCLCTPGVAEPLCVGGGGGGGATLIGARVTPISGFFVGDGGLGDHESSLRHTGAALSVVAGGGGSGGVFAIDDHDFAVIRAAMMG